MYRGGYGGGRGAPGGRGAHGGRGGSRGGGGFPRGGGVPRGGRGGGHGGAPLERRVLGTQPLERLDYLEFRFQRWDADKLLYEFTGPSADNFKTSLTSAHQMPAEQLWHAMLPKLCSPAVLDSLHQERVNTVMVQLLRPEPVMSLTQLLNAAYLADAQLLQHVTSLFHALMDRFPNEALPVLPIDTLQRAVAQCAPPEAAGGGAAGGGAGGGAGSDEGETLENLLGLHAAPAGGRWAHLQASVAELVAKRDRRLAAQAARRAAAAGGGGGGGAVHLPYGFRGATVLPEPRDVLEEGPARLPINKERGAYASLEDYLGTHFVLLREDCLNSLRKGVRLLRDGAHPLDNELRGLVRVYTDVTVLAPSDSRRALGWVVKFSVPRRPRAQQRKEDWSASRKLMLGSLLVLVPTHVGPDAWEDTMVFATVLERDVDLLSHPSGPYIEIEVAANSQATFDPLATYTMIESGAFFEPYRHVLTALQEMPDDPTKLPFSELLLGTSTVTQLPRYLCEAEAPAAARADGRLGALTRPDIAAALARVSIAQSAVAKARAGPAKAAAEAAAAAVRGQVSALEAAPVSAMLLSDAFPGFYTSTGRHVQDMRAEWPAFEHGLDGSQLDAVKLALTSNLVLVQGPPGTGKTFTGVLINKLLLANQRVQRPILFVALTNHALDALLEKVQEFEPRIVRVGGRCKSEALKGRNLVELRQAANLRRNGRQIVDLLSTKERLATQAAGHLARAQVRRIERSNMAVLACGLRWTEPQLESLVKRAYLLPPRSDEAEMLGLESDDEEGGWQQQRGERRGAAQQRLPGRYDDIVSRWLHQPRGAGGAAGNGGGAGGDGGDADEDAAEDALDAAAAALERRDIAEENARREDVLEAGEGPRPNKRALLALLQRRTARRSKRRGSRGSDDDLYMESYDCRYQMELLDIEVQARTQRLAARRGAAAAAAAADLDSDDEVNLPQPDMSEEQLEHVTDMWGLSLRNRRALAKMWARKLRATARAELTEATTAYAAACAQLEELDRASDGEVLRGAAVIGMTTTGAARLRKLLAVVGPRVVVVEEAAECLESHVLAVLPPSTQQAILIGDHQQLRPTVETYRLRTRNKLDISLFERLVNNGVRHVTLHTQHRMRPIIANLLRLPAHPFYQRLHDHESVLTHPPLAGFGANLMFLAHTNPEKGGGGDGSDSLSHSNEYEAAMAVGTVRYALRNGYKPSDIVVLTSYLGQQQLINRHVAHAKQGAKYTFGLEDVRVVTVDNFQGEEANFIVLSLVRSNAAGFVKEANRACVALSRARHGMVIMGNAELLRECGGHWEAILDHLEATGALVHALPMTCSTHAEKHTAVAVPADFLNVSDGGCNAPCDTRLDCGHACTQRCHSDGHDWYECLKACERVKPCGHVCPLKCFEPCESCVVPVERVMPACGHTQTMPCGKDIDAWVCRVACPRRPPGWTCGHPCPGQCGKPCPPACKEWVEVRPTSCPLGHSHLDVCGTDPTKVPCLEPCQAALSCGHLCAGKCKDCARIGPDGAPLITHVPCTQPCTRTLTCGHLCRGRHACNEPCGACEAPCETRCAHSKCNQPCYMLCASCLEPCRNRCAHGACTRKCSEPCDKPRCDEPCDRRLKCGHPCAGLCGELCPSICPTCKPDVLEAITMLPLSAFETHDRFIELADCGHFFEVNGLDHWMALQDFTTHAGDDSEEAAGGGEGAEGGGEGFEVHEAATTGRRMQLPHCPTCRLPIRRSQRYADIVRRCSDAIAELRSDEEGVLASQLQARVSRLLRAKDVAGAEGVARAAIKKRPTWAVGYALLGLVLRTTLDGKVDKARKEKALKELETAKTHATSLNEHMASRWKPFILSHLGALQMELGRPAAAGEALEEAGRLLAAAGGGVAGGSGAGGAMSTAAIEELLAQVAQKVVQQRERGFYYMCPNGHRYLIGECGGAVQTSHCPDCGAAVGGSGHRLLADNRRDTADTTGETPWDRMTRVNPAPDAAMVAAIQRGEL